MVRPDILVDGDVVTSNRGNLNDTVAHVPTSDAVATIDGDQQEHASADFYTRLKAGAQMVGTHADVVATAVKQNADALKQTVEALQESDKTSTDDAISLTKLVDGTAQTTTEATVKASEKTLSSEKAGAAQSSSAGNTSN